MPPLCTECPLDPDPKCSAFVVKELLLGVMDSPQPPSYGAVCPQQRACGQHLFLNLFLDRSLDSSPSLLELSSILKICLLGLSPYRPFIAISFGGILFCLFLNLTMSSRSAFLASVFAISSSLDSWAGSATRASPKRARLANYCAVIFHRKLGGLQHSVGTHCSAPHDPLRLASYAPASLRQHSKASGQHAGLQQSVGTPRCASHTAR